MNLSKGSGAKLRPAMALLKLAGFETKNEGGEERAVLNKVGPKQIETTQRFHSDYSKSVKLPTIRAKLVRMCGPQRASTNYRKLAYESASSFWPAAGMIIMVTVVGARNYN